MTFPKTCTCELVVSLLIVDMTTVERLEIIRDLMARCILIVFSFGINCFREGLQISLEVSFGG